MTTLAELTAVLFPGAMSVGARFEGGGSEAAASVAAASVAAGAEGAGSGSRPAAPQVSWVRVMRARVPAFDALEAGDLAIVPEATLAVVAPGRDERLQLVDACRAARIAGMLLVDQEQRPASDVGPLGSVAETRGSAADGGAFSDLAAGLARAGLPGVRVGPADVAALERSIIGYLVTGGAELERQAAALEIRLERLALEGGGPSALVAAIASHFGRAVALEGRRGDPLALHAPAELPDAALDAIRYQSRPRGPVALRVTLPAAGSAQDVGSDGGSVGSGGGTAPSAGATAHVSGPRGIAGSGGGLVLLGARPPSDLERVAVGRIAGLLALELSRDEAVRRARDVARRAEALPSAGPPWVVLLARQRVPEEADDAAEALERRETNRRELRLIAPARRLALRGDADSLEIRAVLAVDQPDGSDPLGLATAGRIAAFLGRVVAVSRPFGAVGDRPTAEAEARAALEAAEALAGGGPVAQAALLPIYRMLGALHHLGDGERLARVLLEPLSVGRADVQREHTATLRALLEHGGPGEAAMALGVHRNTVTYRLRRIESITGWNLADPDVRLGLLIALRLVQNR